MLPAERGLVIRSVRLREAFDGNTLLRSLSGEGVRAVLIRGALFSFLIGILARVISFPTNIMITRSLGAENYGIYVFVQNWVGIPALLALLGFETSLIRFMSSYRASGEYGLMRGLLIRARTLVFVANCTAAIAVAVTVMAMGDRLSESVRWTFLVICASMPFMGQRVVQNVALLGLRRFVWSQMTSAVVAPTISALAILAFYLWRGQGIAAYEAAGIHALASIVLLGAGAWLVRRAAPPETWLAKPLYRTREWLRVSLPLVLVAGMQQLLNRVSIILVGMFAGTTAAGVFMIASGLAQFTSFGLVATNTVAAPLFSELHTKGAKADMQRVVSLASWASTLSALGIALLLLGAGGLLLGLFGSEFTGGSTVLSILVVSLVVDAWTGPNGAWLNMSGNQDRYGVILGVSAAMNLLLSIPAIIYWGIEGAAVVTFVATSFKNAWVWIEVKRSLDLNASIFGSLPWR